MAIKVLELHHHGIRVRLDKADECKAFYENVLGLNADPGRPTIPGIPGYWMDLPDDTQIHIMGCDDVSPFAKGPGQDPTRYHVALAVESVPEAKAELDRMGVKYWTMTSLVGPELEQLFMDDPNGNMVELHQIGTCRCKKSDRPAPTAYTAPTPPRMA